MTEKHSRKSGRSRILILFMTVFCVVLVLAGFSGLMALEEGTDHSGAHSEGGGAFLGKVLNFIILFGGLGFLLRKPIANYLAGRGDDIGKSLQNAESSRKSAQTNLKKAQKRLKEMAGEVQKIKKESEENGRRTRDDILQTARRESERLKEQAAQEIEALTQVGIRDLKAYAAEAAISLARRRIEDRITSENQAELINRSIEKIEVLYEKSGSD
jgi:F-type H+-transporting ATPase subunit b